VSTFWYLTYGAKAPRRIPEFTFGSKCETQTAIHNGVEELWNPVGVPMVKRRAMKRGHHHRSDAANPSSM
jgi:hypothetical protein